MKVYHKEYGEAEILKIASINEYMIVKFENGHESAFRFPYSFEVGWFQTQNEDLLQMLQKAWDGEEVYYEKEEKTIPKKPKRTPKTNDIAFDSEEELCNALGYLATPGNAVLLAFVPEYNTNQFLHNFGDQPYISVTNKRDTAGHLIKTPIYCRIQIRNKEHMPEKLKEALGKNDIINKDVFVKKLVNSYGFQFGQKQDIDNIRYFINIRNMDENAFDAYYDETKETDEIEEDAYEQLSFELA